MPTGPKGQKRPADAIGLAVMVGRIATGEVVDHERETPEAAPAKSVKKQTPQRASHPHPRKPS